MRKRGSRLIYAPTDLARFVQSPFAAWMERHAVEFPGEIEPDPRGEDLQIVLRKGREHEAAVLAQLRAEGRDVLEIAPGPGHRAATERALRDGREVICQGLLARGEFEGRPDFLLRVDAPSGLGGHLYEPLEAKLARSVKPGALVQLGCYASMLERAQGVLPPRIRVAPGRGDAVALRTLDFIYYCRSLESAFLRFMAEFDPARPPIPEHGEDHGRWQSHAEEYLERVDHLSCVAGMGPIQVRRLQAAGLATTAALARAELPLVPRMPQETYLRLRAQARLQVQSAGLERPLYEIVPPDPDRPRRGLGLLPPASPLDVYFDMEGYALGREPLEYLFGASHADGGSNGFTDWWAHDRAQEKAAFEACIDWVTERHRRDGAMHVYHYASYEVSAIKRLMGRHGTREVAVDALLRDQVFVDLHQVVRDGVRVGEPRYSLKNLERLYRGSRRGQVGTATDSIVFYDRWLESGEPPDWRESPLLRQIRDYNRDDCESTLLLTRWLRERQREHGIAWAGPVLAREGREPREARETSPLAATLLTRAGGREAQRHDELFGHLVEFHRREDRPMWWAMFDRHAMTEEELIDDPGCLGGLELDRDPPVSGSGCTSFAYRFDPEQDTRLAAGDRCYFAHSLDVAAEIGELRIDEGRVTLRLRDWQVARLGGEPPRRLSLLPDEYVPADVISRSIQTTAQRWLEGLPVSAPLLDFLDRRPPRIRDRPAGPLLDDDEPPERAAVRLVAAMDGTTLSIQGPPGSGKTTTAARAILALLARGLKVGVSSNSHKAILNLLARCAAFSDWRLPCMKVGGRADDPFFRDCAGALHVASKEVVERLERAPLVGGTAWLFSRAELRDRLDYLFVDEAGQVSVANLVGMAPSARNLVLVGDHRQLPQPIQGAHPGSSGRSALDYLLGEWPTIPAEMGIFLDTTYRLHPDLCEFVSAAFYDERLRPAAGCENRVVRVGRPATEEDAAPAGLAARLEPAGLVFVPVEHEGNTQASPEEVDAIAEIVRQLLGRERTDLEGRVAGRIGPEDILVVAPYNLQVRKLGQRLPDLRVGTVDKFQGQEAPVVIVSLCSSEGHASPRGLDFLLNPNRLNVALSRARSLAVVVGHPGLAGTRCGTVEQVRLVNLLCAIVARAGRPR